MNKRRWKKIILYGIATFLSIFALYGITEFFIYIGPNRLILHPHEYLYYDINDNLCEERLYSYSGKYIPLDEMPEMLKIAVVEIEDQRFYSHKGFDAYRVAGSIIANIRSNSLKQGASTITQQLARTLYLSTNKSIVRKINEILIARKLEMQYTKSQILEAYLNNIYFGHNLYGIYQASYYYFQKKPTNLSLSEITMLVGIIASPNNYAPDINPELSKQRQLMVLSTLYKRGYINEEEYLQATKEELNYYYNFETTNSLASSYYLDATTSTMNSLNILTKQSINNGLTIKTYENTKISNEVDKIIENTIPQTIDEEISVVIMQPGSGNVLTLVGGKNHAQSAFNRATSAYRQVGSTIKPIIYYLALCAGMTPLSKLVSEPTTFQIANLGEYTPQNNDLKYAKRQINMIEAIGLSDNIYAVKTTLLLGSKHIANFLENFGIGIQDVNPTIGLGSVSMTPLQLCSIYNTFASGGVYYTPTLLREVSLTNGKVLKKALTSPTLLLNQHNVNVLHYLLRAPFDASLKTYASPSLMNYQLTGRFCAKTGTTEFDSWVIGYNPSFTLCVWVGTDDNAIIKNSNLAKQLFSKIANYLISRSGDIFFSIPSNSNEIVLTNNITGKKSFTYYTT